ncbi:MAG TPA: hypothetical protein VHO24_05075 [Opitutaceae bacterium]|nr:hypothetical protein [Opitutaceae bacterium]
MFNLNRKHTSAVKQLARETERLATAEEEIARNLKAILGSDQGGASSARPIKNVTPAKNKPPGK